MPAVEGGVECVPGEEDKGDGLIGEARPSNLDIVASVFPVPLDNRNQPQNDLNDS